MKMSKPEEECSAVPNSNQQNQRKRLTQHQNSVSTDDLIIHHPSSIIAFITDTVVQAAAETIIKNCNPLEH